MRSARDAGLTRARVDATDLIRPFHGVRDTAAGPNDDAEWWVVARETILSRARAYATKLPADAHFSHATAATIHGLPVPRRLALSASIDVCATRPNARRRGRGVRTHLSAASAAHVIQLNGLRVSDPLHTWCELSSSLTVDECTTMADALMRRKKPIADPDRLVAAALSWQGRRGYLVLRAALDLARPGTDSVRETELRLAIVHGGLPEPEVNPRIVDAKGRFLGHGDAVYAKYKVLVEYDGEQHRKDDAQYVIDVERLEAFARDGWLCVRILKQHAAHEFAPAVRKVRRALQDRGWRPPASAPNAPKRSSR